LRFGDETLGLSNELFVATVTGLNPPSLIEVGCPLDVFFELFSVWCMMEVPSPGQSPNGIFPVRERKPLLLGSANSATEMPRLQSSSM